MSEKYLPKGYVLQSPTTTYVINEVLGSGGFGITYSATTKLKLGNIETAVKVAIKEHFMNNDCERDVNSAVCYSAPARERVENSLKDFMAEARRLSKVGVNHDNMVKVNEVFEANNTAYYVMEYLDGSSLSKYVKSHGAISPEETLVLMRPVIEAVGYLHQNRITHLDIKPDNIMLKTGDDGRLIPVLIDFGLSKHYNEDATPTSTINTLGYSEGYAPIEQYAGIRSFSPVSDIYGLGATMFFCLTGTVPPSAPEAGSDEIRKRLNAVSDSRLVEAVAQAMQMRGKDRPQTCAQLLDLAMAGDGIKNDSVETVKIEVPPQPVIFDSEVDEEPAGNGKKWLVIVLIALLLGGAAAGIYFKQHDDKSTVDDTEELFQVNGSGEFMPDENASPEPSMAKNLPDEVQPVTEIRIVDDEPAEVKVAEEKSAGTVSDAGTDDIHRNVTAVKEEVVVEPVKPAPPVEDDKIFNVVERMPSFPGGEAAMFRWLSAHINYPSQAAENAIQGKVIVQFVVNKTGGIENVKVLRGKDPDLDKEAVRVVRSMPNWIPGEQNGIPVNVYYTIPINFRLQ